MPGPVELLIMAGVVIVLFGSRKLPEAARSMGRSMRIFKSEVRGLHDDDNRAATALPIGSTVGSTVGAAPVTEPTPVTHDAVA